uniref:Transporter n=3 Tax=Bursaphelenchus xylophilus TaxID=6326 RepID=A0A1I7S7U7_BURXY
MPEAKTFESEKQLTISNVESSAPPTSSVYVTADGMPTEDSISHEKESDQDRQTWGNGIQFLLTCISFAVGLGNIWRFPALVYENGGGTFLIPYFFCSMVIGFPVVYLELSLGQFARAGPSVVFGRIKPAFHGIGWTMVLNSVFIAIYYNVVVAWIMIYMVMVIIRQDHKWSECRGDHNTIYCQSYRENQSCTEQLGAPSFYFNRSCFLNNDTAAILIKNATFADKNAVSPTEEFFDNYVLQRAPDANDFSPNWMIIGAFFVSFTLTAVGMYKGPKIIGKLSYFLAIAPYAIIAILFGRAITLEGRDIGLHYYLLEFKPEVLVDLRAWQAAASQVCFSLSIGVGGILSYATYNKKSHNVFRDAFVIACADCFMSVFGGTAVFCMLGFMSQSLGVNIEKVVKDGTALAFVVYPEATSWLPIPSLWSFLFFLMLFLLGFSTEFGFLEAIITAFSDQFPILHRNKGLTTIGVCFVLFLCGLSMCTRSGFYYFSLVNSYAAGFSLIACVLFESALIAYCYGLKKYTADLRSMFGPPKHLLGKIFGPTGLYVKLIWLVGSPLLWGGMTIATIYRQIFYRPSVGKDYSLYYFPDWLVAIGWVISVIPFCTIPGFLVYNIVQFQCQNKPLSELWKCQPKWPAFKRQRPEEYEKLKNERMVDEQGDGKEKESKDETTSS